MRVFYRKHYDPVNKKTPDPFYFIKPFLSFGANQEQLLAAIGSLRLHHSAKHVEQEGFSFHIAHARKLGHIRGDVNLVIKAYPVECARVSEEEGEKRGEGFDVLMAGD